MPTYSFQDNQKANYTNTFNYAFAQQKIEGQAPFSINLAKLLNPNNLNPASIRFCAVGCHGTKTSKLGIFPKGEFYNLIKGAQEAIAGHMAGQMATNNDPSAFCFLVGDNFYDTGVDNPNHNYFTSNYSNIYQTTRPNFMALGNHDYGFMGGAPRDINPHLRAMSQVDHTYLNVANGNVDDKWYMPYRYYCLSLPFATFYVLDSSRFYFDLDQQSWLQQAYRQFSRPGRWDILVAHHPFVSYGKRGEGHSRLNDLSKYAYDPIQSHGQLTAHGNINQIPQMSVSDSFSQSVWSLTKGGMFQNTQRLNFHALICAHDHFSAVSLLPNNNQDGVLLQILAGAGGAPAGKAKADAIEAAANRTGGHNLDIHFLLEKEHAYSVIDLSAERLRVEFYNQNNTMKYCTNYRYWRHGSRPG